MKNQYLSSALTLLFLFLFACGFSQDLDLIVTTKGDSIACRIDSITETHIYFEMKSQNKWAHTHIGLTDVSEYKRSAIDKKKYVFKAGTSIIASQKVIKPIKPVKPVKNAVKTDLFAWMLNIGVLKYERVFSENISVQLGFYYTWEYPTMDDVDFATGFAITPEFRYYLSKKRPAPRGVYLAPNFRYEKFEYENLDDNSEATVINTSIAINLGLQLVLKDLF
ncbi:MAG: DUF3575 domain-containing protein, partial [Bacteroidales bacterium]|nr:DUF3575 domain-containing protein [Bacteroidales bacterium]